MQKNKPAKRVSGEQTAFEARGTCTVEEAGRIRTLLMEKLRESDRVVLSLSGVDEADLSFLQLLCAVHKSAFNARKTLVLDGVPSEPLTRKAREAGFACRRECGPDLSKDCFWAEA